MAALGPDKYLTIHCAATPEGRDNTAAEVNQWDIERFGQISYHWVIELDGDAVRGLPDFVKAAMARAAADRGKPGQHAVTLSRSIIEPFLTFSTRRDLREEAFIAWSKRGENGGESDNRAIVAEMVKLRAEKAKLLGYPTFAHFKLDDAMAKTPQHVRDLL